MPDNGQDHIGTRRGTALPGHPADRGATRCPTSRREPGRAPARVRRQRRRRTKWPSWTHGGGGVVVPATPAL